MITSHVCVRVWFPRRWRDPTPVHRRLVFPNLRPTSRFYASNIKATSFPPTRKISSLSTTTLAMNLTLQQPRPVSVSRHHHRLLPVRRLTAEITVIACIQLFNQLLIHRPIQNQWIKSLVLTQVPLIPRRLAAPNSPPGMRSVQKTTGLPPVFQTYVAFIAYCPFPHRCEALVLACMVAGYTVVCTSVVLTRELFTILQHMLIVALI